MKKIILTIILLILSITAFSQTPFTITSNKLLMNWKDRWFYILVNRDSVHFNTNLSKFYFVKPIITPGLTVSNYTFPASDGSANKVLGTDGAGNLGWYGSMTGPTGPTGPQGIQGIQGVTGPQGPTGSSYWSLTGNNLHPTDNNNYVNSYNGYYIHNKNVIIGDEEDNKFYLGFDAGQGIATDPSNYICIGNGDTITSWMNGHFNPEYPEQSTIKLNGRTMINNSYWFPLTDGDSLQVLSTDSHGNTFWRTVSGGGGSQDLQGVLDSGSVANITNSLLVTNTAGASILLEVDKTPSSSNNSTLLVNWDKTELHHYDTIHGHSYVWADTAGATLYHKNLSNKKTTLTISGSAIVSSEVAGFNGLQCTNLKVQDVLPSTLLTKQVFDSIVNQRIDSLTGQMPFCIKHDFTLSELSTLNSNKVDVIVDYVDREIIIDTIIFMLSGGSGNELDLELYYYPTANDVSATLIASGMGSLSANAANKFGAGFMYNTTVPSGNMIFIRPRVGKDMGSNLPDYLTVCLLCHYGTLLK